MINIKEIIRKVNRFYKSKRFYNGELKRVERSGLVLSRYTETMPIDRSKRVSFEAVADLYNETSGEYPAAWIADVIALAETPAGGRILEIGCGPGNATIGFARRGFPILAVELGQRMAEIARERCRDYPQVHILQQTFEDWPGEENAFDLVLAADSLHWIEPAIAYPKIARALRPGGALAVSASAPVVFDAPWLRAVDAVYREMAPQFVNPDQRFSIDWLIAEVKGAIAASGWFAEPALRQHSWSEIFDSEHYIKMLWTFSMHAGIDDDLRRRLYARIAAVIEQFGPFEQPRTALVFVARVRK
jgi:SAM-dependent methyltransferase